MPSCTLYFYKLLCFFILKIEWFKDELMMPASMHFIVSQLNQFFKSNVKLTENIGVSNLVDGNLNRPNYQQKSSQVTQFIAMSNEPISLNFTIIIAAYFAAKNYLESLRFISNFVSYFQCQSVFDHLNLFPCINAIFLERENVGHSALRNKWRCLTVILFTIKISKSVNEGSGQTLPEVYVNYQ